MTPFNKAVKEIDSKRYNDKSNNSKITLNVNGLSHLSKGKEQAWRDGSPIKNTCCFSDNLS